MNIKHLPINFAKLLLGGVVFSVSVIVGGMLATLVQLHPATPPAGMDMSTAARNLMLESPILALALALLARGLGGSFAMRALALSFLT
jgi:hypothetical protein